ncbi:MAG: hypothetical protein ACLUVV_07395 [Christensenellales bacterium]
MLRHPRDGRAMCVALASRRAVFCQNAAFHSEVLDTLFACPEELCPSIG